MQIFFCEKCSRRLSDADIENGSAIAVKDLVYCRACAKALGITITWRTEIVEKSKTEKHPTKRAQPSDGQPQPRAVHPYLVPAVIGGVAFVLLIVLVIFSFSKPSPQAVNPPVPPVREKSINEKVPLENPMLPPETPAPKESPKPVTAETPKAPAADTPKPSAISGPIPAAGNTMEETLLSSDLEKDKLGWQVGTRVEDSSQPGLKWVIETPAGGNRVIFAASDLRPRRDSIFDGAENTFINFDYFISPGTEPAFLTYTVWEAKSAMNWYANDVPVPRGKWGTHRINVAKEFMPVAGHPIPMPKDASITEVKIGVKCTGQACSMRLDNLHITRTAPAKAEKVVLSGELATGANGWAWGARVSEDTLEGTKWVYRSVPESKDKNFGRKISFSSHDMKPPKEQLFHVTPNSVFVLEYYVTNASGYEAFCLLFWDDAVKANIRHTVEHPVLGKWTELRVRLTDVVSYGKRISDGDPIDHIVVCAGPSGDDMELIVSGLRVIEEP